MRALGECSTPGPHSMRLTSNSTCMQDVWPTATRLATVYAGGGNGVFGAWDSGLQFTGPSAPYLQFSVGSSKVGLQGSIRGAVVVGL